MNGDVSVVGVAVSCNGTICAAGVTDFAVTGGDSDAGNSRIHFRNKLSLT
jgi:hypothetical protein